MKRTVLPKDVARCRPSKPCSKQANCARFNSPIPQGSPVMDGMAGIGLCFDFLPTHGIEAAPEVKAVKPPVRGIA